MSDWTFVIDLPPTPQITFILSLVGFVVWLLVVLRVGPRIVLQGPIEPEVRAAALVTILLVMLTRAITAGLNAWGVSTETLTLLSTITSSVAIVGGIYAFIGTFARQDEE